MLVNVLAKIRKIKRTAKAIRKNYSKKSKIAVVLLLTFLGLTGRARGTCGSRGRGCR